MRIAKKDLFSQTPVIGVEQEMRKTPLFKSAIILKTLYTLKDELTFDTATLALFASYFHVDKELIRQHIRRIKNGVKPDDVELLHQKAIELPRNQLRDWIFNSGYINNPMPKAMFNQLAEKFGLTVAEVMRMLRYCRQQKNVAKRRYKSEYHLAPRKLSDGERRIQETMDYLQANSLVNKYLTLEQKNEIAKICNVSYYTVRLAIERVRKQQGINFREETKELRHYLYTHYKLEYNISKEQRELIAQELKEAGFNLYSSKMMREHFKIARKMHNVTRNHRFTDDYKREKPYGKATKKAQ